MSFQVIYVTMITKAPKRLKTHVMVTRARFSVVFPIGPKPSVVGVCGVEVFAAMLIVLQKSAYQTDEGGGPVTGIFDLNNTELICDVFTSS